MKFLVIFLVVIVALLLSYGIYCSATAILLDSKKLWCSSFIHKVDKTLNKKLSSAIKSGIEYAFKTRFDLDIRFKDGTTCRLWNENKWYAWASKGNIISPDGSAYIWDNKRPSRKTMIKLQKALEAYDILR